VVSVHIIDPLQKFCHFHRINDLGRRQAKPLIPLNLVFGQTLKSLIPYLTNVGAHLKANQIEQAKRFADKFASPEAAQP
jgi:hypothetical protein